MALPWCAEWIDRYVAIHAAGRRTAVSVSITSAGPSGNGGSVGTDQTTARRAGDRSVHVPLVERDRELRRLERLMLEAAAGSGGALLICGEAGIGKTTLLRRTLAEFSDLSRLTIAGVRTETRSPGAALERFLGLLNSTRKYPNGPNGNAGPLSTESVLTPLIDAVEVSRQLRQDLEVASATGPLVLIVEDAQWVDRETLAVIGSLSRRLADLAVALIVVGDVAELPELADIERVPLTRLQPRHVVELVGALAPCAVSPGVAAAIAWASSGNPLAVSDMVGQLSVDQLSGRVRVSGPYQVGSRLTEAFAGCLLGLDERCRRALALVASTGGRAGVLESTLERAGLSMADLYPAEDAGLLRLASSRVAFVHPLGRAAVYSGTPPVERRWARTLTAEALAVAAEEGASDLIVDRIVDADKSREEGQAPREAHSCDFSVTLLGGFAVFRGGTDVTPTQPQPAQAVKVVALRRHLSVDELVEALWPGAEPGVGRGRLRNVLSRVRESCPGLLVREGELVGLGREVSVDAHVFDKAALAALADGGSAEGSDLIERATWALALYAGELLPTDRYSIWASVERERLANRYRELIGLLVTEYERSDNIAAAVRLLEDAIALEPYDEDLYIRAAALMARLGWRSRALQMLRGAEAVAADLGVAPSHEVKQVRARLSESG